MHHEKFIPSKKTEKNSRKTQEVDEHAYLMNEADVHMRPYDVVKYGAIPAILLYNIRYWVRKNAANEMNFHDGHYWTYNSVDAYCKQFPYLTKKQIEKGLKKLRDMEAIKKGRFKQKTNGNSTSTNWYTITDCEVKLPQKGKFISPKGETQANYHYTDKKQQMGKSAKKSPPKKKQAIELLDHFNKVCGRRKRPGDRNLKILSKALEIYPLEDLKMIVETKAEEWLGNPKMEKHLEIETLFERHLDKYMEKLIDLKESGKFYGPIKAQWEQLLNHEDDQDDGEYHTN